MGNFNSHLWHGKWLTTITSNEAESGEHTSMTGLSPNTLLSHSSSQGPAEIHDACVPGVFLLFTEGLGVQDENSTGNLDIPK